MLAPAPATVHHAGHSGQHGHLCALVHDDGKLSIFSHLDGPAPVRPGQRVRAGDVIGHVGQVGTRGYELRWHLLDEQRQTLDPREFLRQPEVKVGGLLALSVLMMGMLLWWDETEAKGSPRGRR